MLRAFVREEFTERGIVADIAIHEPDARDGEKQPHAHIMVSDRPLDASQPNGLAAKKDRTLADAKGIEALRERWATHCNRALERAHVPERVDHRSLADQRRAMLVVAVDNTRPQAEREVAEVQAAAMNRSPEPKIGPVAMKMERQGKGEQAFALRDALTVREERGILIRIVETWQQIHDQVAQLRQVITQRLSEEQSVRKSVEDGVRRVDPARTRQADAVRTEFDGQPVENIEAALSLVTKAWHRSRQDVERFNKPTYEDYVDSSAWDADLRHTRAKKVFEDTNRKLEAWREAHPFRAMLGEGFGEHKRLYEAAVKAGEAMCEAEQGKLRAMKAREEAAAKANIDLSAAEKRTVSLKSLLAERQEAEIAIAKALPASREAKAVEDRRREVERHQKAEQERKALEAAQKAQKRGKGHRRH
jgi:hypothetical protein